MFLLHGENLVASRQRLLDLVTAARSQGKDVVTLEAARLSLHDLEHALGADDLFGTSKLVIIEELHSLPTSPKKTEFIGLVTTYMANTPIHDIVLWEKRALTPTMLKQFPRAQTEQFKISPAVFTWLDSLSPVKNTKPKQLKLLREALTADDAFMCFAMFIRQIRLLIQMKDGVKVAGAPFMISKLQKQATLFDQSSLLTTHHKLLEIDRSFKTSTNLLGLDQHLDLLVLDL